MVSIFWVGREDISLLRKNQQGFVKEKKIEIETQSGDRYIYLTKLNRAIFW